MIDWLLRSAFERTVEEVGSAIVQGRMEPDSVATVDHLVTTTGASRSVVREATRVLGAMGLLTASRRVGLTIAPSEAWNSLDPRVIRWRLAGPSGVAQRAELIELRAAVEPEAARLAALRHDDATVPRLRADLERMRLATAARDAVAFHDGDRRLHGAILEASDNSMFIRLQSVIDEALLDRAPTTPVGWRVAADDVELHAALVDAVAERRTAVASEVMRRIVEGH